MSAEPTKLHSRFGHAGSLMESPIQRLHRELAEYKRARDEALTGLTLALVEIGKQVNRPADPDPDDWFAA